MTANEDPAARSNAEAAGAEQPGDELEDWLTDLRTDVAADPPGWIDEEPGSDHPTGPGISEPSRGGRHRAPDE
jgi:hypothetical protein